MSERWDTYCCWLNGHVVRWISRHLCLHSDICATLHLGQGSFLDNWVIVNAEIDKWLKS